MCREAKTIGARRGGDGSLRVRQWTGILVHDSRKMFYMSSQSRCPIEVGRYTSYEGPISANKKRRKLGIFNRKLEGIHSILCYYLKSIEEK